MEKELGTESDKHLIVVETVVLAVSDEPPKLVLVEPPFGGLDEGLYVDILGEVMRGPRNG